jgi:ElaB/YqjD/DUF883 family membrane-anchored ribosome-binding protein
MRRDEMNRGGEDLTQQSGYEPQEGTRSAEGYTEGGQFDAYGNAGSTGGKQREAKERVKESAGRAKEQAAEVADKARRQADQGMDKAAEGLHGTAEKLRERAEEQGGVTADAGQKVADTMERTAGYLREHDTQELMDDLERYVREHPMQAVAGAVIGGFLIGRILS